MRRLHLGDMVQPAWRGLRGGGPPVRVCHPDPGRPRLSMNRSAIRVCLNGFTATGLVQASTQWTRSLAGSAENPIDKRNSRTH